MCAPIILYDALNELLLVFVHLDDLFAIIVTTMSANPVSVPLRSVQNKRPPDVLHQKASLV